MRQLQPSRQTPIRMPSFQRRQEHHLDRQSRHPQHPPKISHQRLLPHERRIAAALAVLKKTQGHGLDLDGGRAGRFEQAGVERQEREAFGRRAFGEQADGVALFEAGLHRLAHRVDRVALAAFDEQRAGARHQPADDGPGADFALGDERRGARRIQHENVDPGDVVRHQQHRALQARLALEGDAQATGRHQAARPAAVQPGARGGAQQGIYQADTEQAEDDQRQDKAQA
ncbi:hypothetical protein D3C86_1362360 [compost metagenome]